MIYRLPCALLLILLALPSLAAAKAWDIDYSKSQLGFVGKQGETTFNGSFRDYQLAIDLDPERPETGKISAVIKTASATAGSAERDSYLPQSDWFDVSKFPEARFTSTTIHKENAAYIADGTLTIKNVSRPVTLRFTLTPEGELTRAKGSTNLMRNHFKLGLGDWANENYVKYDVQVVFDVVAKPIP
jgi:polyisoprenoid-binding protein YceI